MVIRTTLCRIIQKSRFVHDPHLYQYSPLLIAHYGAIPSIVQKCRSSSTTINRPSLPTLLPQKRASELRPGPPSRTTESLSELLNGLEIDANNILGSSKIPDVAITLRALKTCEDIAKFLSEKAEDKAKITSNNGSPTSNLLFLEEQRKHNRHPEVNTPNRVSSSKVFPREQVSSTAFCIISDPKVFITPELLDSYVNTQALLGRPESFPHVFDLYRSKPIPKPNTNPVEYSKQNPKKISASIPLPVTNKALAAAIKARDLSSCFDIVNKSVCTSAYRRSKLFREALIPVSAAALAPFAIYKLASELSIYQETMDTFTATNLYFGGILAYVGFTATIGFVAITTANDQMDRITWAVGTPLRERWMREEERMMVDRIAGAWGFQERWRRGEEEGSDWEALREWAGMRGMVLDRTELMDGMQ
ncbi:MAG: hypothetical protein LQ342_001623 [Letrouitia transgressa]|nr:MAG: hypothetical protein LQ342_001623 [Letrouitia transgressa]